MIRWRRRLPVAIAAVCVLSAVAVYALVDPASHFFPRCIWHEFTGLNCPGCGSQRALHALLNGNIAFAFRHNAMMVIMLPVVALMFIAQFWNGRFPRLYGFMNSRAVIWAVFAIIMLWWVLRCVIGV